MCMRSQSRLVARDTAHGYSRGMCTIRHSQEAIVVQSTPTQQVVAGEPCVRASVGRRHRTLAAAVDVGSKI